MRYIFFLLIFLLSCDAKKTKPEEVKKDPTEGGINKTYDKNGKLQNEVMVKDGKRNGLSKAYYSNGKIKLEVPYKNDRREGTSRRYYEDGKLYSETQYVNDLIQGTQKKYGEDQKLISEATFLKGEPCKGLKEYNDNGSVKSSFPTIVISVDDEMRTTGYYTLKVSLSDHSKRVNFYEGALTKEGCLGSDISNLDVDTKTGVGKIIYPMPPGSSMNKELSIIAVIKTYASNSYIVQRNYHLAIDNR